MVMSSPMECPWGKWMLKSVYRLRRASLFQTLYFIVPESMASSASSAVWRVGWDMRRSLVPKLR